MRAYSWVFRSSATDLVTDLIDNTRLVSEFGMQYRPYRERVLQIINDVRKEQGLAPLAPADGTERHAAGSAAATGRVG